MCRITILLLALIFFTSCQNSADHSEVSLEDIPTFTPKELISFDHAGDFYFSHLGYSSVVLGNGDILIPERQNTGLAVVDTEGNLKKFIYEGRGPGEILDAYNFVQDVDGNVYVYDQGNGKILTLDSEAALAKEIIPPPFEGANIDRVFPMENENIIFDYSSNNHLFNEDEDHEKILVNYNPATEKYEEKLNLKDIPFAPLVLYGSVMGGMQVSFANAQLIAYQPENKSLILFNTKTSNIAQINSAFDTLKSMPVNLPKERVYDEEISKIESEVEFVEQWKTLKPLIPEYKAVASRMMYYNDKIWLKTHLRGDHQKWLILNMEGEIEQVVNLPKESRLMHISDEHLGVRLDDVTYALYESVN